MRNGPGQPLSGEPGAVRCYALRITHYALRITHYALSVRTPRCRSLHERRQLLPLRNELQAHPVVAVPQPRRVRAVVEHVALVAAAAGAVVLRARDDHVEVALRLHVAWHHVV